MKRILVTSVATEFCKALGKIFMRTIKSLCEQTMKKLLLPRLSVKFNVIFSPYIFKINVYINNSFTNLLLTIFSL